MANISELHHALAEFIDEYGLTVHGRMLLAERLLRSCSDATGSVDLDTVADDIQEWVEDYFGKVD